MLPLRLVEPQGIGYGGNRRRGDVPGIAIFERGVPRDPDAGYCGNFLAAQTGNAPSSSGRQTGLLWRDPRAPFTQEAP